LSRKARSSGISAKTPCSIPSVSHAIPCGQVTQTIFFPRAARAIFSALSPVIDATTTASADEQAFFTTLTIPDVFTGPGRSNKGTMDQTPEQLSIFLLTI